METSNKLQSYFKLNQQSNDLITSFLKEIKDEAFQPFSKIKVSLTPILEKISGHPKSEIFLEQLFTNLSENNKLIKEASKSLSKPNESYINSCNLELTLANIKPLANILAEQHGIDLNATSEEASKSFVGKVR